MNKFKSILCLCFAIMLLAMPLSVSATGEDSSLTSSNVSSEAELSTSLTLKATVNGIVPENTTFTFKIIKAPFDPEFSEIGDAFAPTDFVIDTSVDTEGKQFVFDETKDVCYSIKLDSSSNKDLKLDGLSINIYFGGFVKAEIIRDDLPVEGVLENENPDITNKAITVTFNNTFAEKVSVSTDGCPEFEKVYDGKTDAKISDKNYKLVGVAEGHDVKLAYNSVAFNNANVKNATKITVSDLSLTGADADKYLLTTDKFEIKAKINPRPITVTADNIVMTLGQAEPELTYKLSDELIEGNTVIGTLARASGNTVGDYAITRGTLSFGDNYEITFKEGKLTVSTYSHNEIKDSSSSVSVSGYFDASAKITVTALDPTSATYNNLASSAAWGTIVGSYDITFTDSGFDGHFTITIPVDSALNGKEITVYQQLSSGAISFSKAIVENGSITFNTDECSQFMLVAEKKKSYEKDDSSALTVLKVIVTILAIIVGLGLLLVFFFFGMIFFNKTEQLKRIIKAIKRIFGKK